MRIAKFMDSVYCEPYFYLHDQHTGIWRKGVDRDEPIHWLEVDLISKRGKTLKKAFKGKALIAALDEKELLVVRTANKMNQLKIKIKQGDCIADFSAQGKAQNSVLTISINGWIELFKVNLVPKDKEFDINQEPEGTLRLATQRIELLSGRNEVLNTLNVCSSNTKYFVISSCNKEHEVASRMFVFEVKDSETIYRKSWVDLRTLGTPVKPFFCLNIRCFSRAYFIISGLSFSTHHTSLHSFVYNDLSKRSMEVVGLRRTLTFGNACKFCEFQDVLYAVDYSGKMLKFYYTDLK